MTPDELRFWEASALAAVGTMTFEEGDTIADCSGAIGALADALLEERRKRITMAYASTDGQHWKVEDQR